MDTGTPYRELAPEAYRNLRAQTALLRACGLEPGLILLVEVRISQINGCAFCVDMHHREALEAGESPRRLALLSAWRDTTFFSERERAALAWAEELTRLPRVEEPGLQATLRSCFTDRERVHLTHAIALMNTWNRLGVAFHPALPPLAPEHP